MIFNFPPPLPSGTQSASMRAENALFLEKGGGACGANGVLGLAPRAETAEAGKAFPDELLVMAGLSSHQMNQLLQGFRRKKIPPVELKAVLTASNGGWNAYQLRDELKREHEAMLRGENLHEGRSL